MDTEFTWRHHVAGCSVEEMSARSIEPAVVGLSWQLDTLGDTASRCFFVDAAPAALFGIEVVSAIADARQSIAPALREGVIELPVGVIEESGERMRTMQIRALSTEEMTAALWHAPAREHVLTTIVSRSFELATRCGGGANGAHRERFETLCRFLSQADLGDRRRALRRPAAAAPDLGQPGGDRRARRL